MIKLIVGLAGVGFVLLAAATVALAWLNWSSRLYMPILTALVVGTATGFVSIVGGLKASSLKDTFATPVVVFRDAVGAPVAIARSREAVYRLDLAMLLGQLPSPGKRNASSDEIFNTGLEAAQYAVFKLLAEAHRGGWSTLNLQGASSATIRSTPELPLTNLSTEALKHALAQNRFSGLPSEEFYWAHGRFPVPPDVRVEMVHVPSSSSGVDKRLIRFKKPLFFELVVTLETLGIDSGLPTDVEVSAAEEARAGTLNVRISTVATFEALTAGNARTDEYKLWAQWIAKTLRERLTAPRS